VGNHPQRLSGGWVKIGTNLELDNPCGGAHDVWSERALPAFVGLQLMGEGQLLGNWKSEDLLTNWFRMGFWQRSGAIPPKAVFLLS
jgi:hypothetical protein